MFGKNPIRTREVDALNLAIADLFYTLQGECLFGGTPALFVRLAGCNLACTFCDTEFETGADAPIALARLGRMIEKFNPQQRRLVVITGGEPLRQNIRELCRFLYDTGTEHIQIETAGTLWVVGLEEYVEDGRMTIVCSPKTPKLHYMVERLCRHWKYVVRASDRRGFDGLPTTGTQAATENINNYIARPPERESSDGLGPDTIWLLPCDEMDAEKNAANTELARDLCLEKGYRLTLQMHKTIGVK